MTVSLIQGLRVLCSCYSWEPHHEPDGLLDVVYLDRLTMQSSSRVSGR